MPPRTASQRRLDTLDTLRRVRDVWVASASETGDAYLIPLSYVWDGDRMIMATPAASKTTRNLARAGWAKLALPSTDDVVILEGPIEILPLDADDALADAHATAAGFDPRQETNPYVYIRVTPTRIQAWRDVAELRGRTIMRDGRWVDA